jgi:hypothetical protein
VRCRCFEWNNRRPWVFTTHRIPHDISTYCPANIIWWTVLQNSICYQCDLRSSSMDHRTEKNGILICHSVHNSCSTKLYNRFYNLDRLASQMRSSQTNPLKQKIALLRYHFWRKFYVKISALSSRSAVLNIGSDRAKSALQNAHYVTESSNSASRFFEFQFWGVCSAIFNRDFQKVIGYLKIANV